MEIKSAIPGFTLELSRNDEADPYSNYTMHVATRTSFGNFTGENAALQLSAFPTFIQNLKNFLETRKGEAHLQLTEDSGLYFFRWNSKGDVGLRFNLSCYAPLGNAGIHPTTLSGVFPLDNEFLNQMYAEFTQLTA